MKVVRFPNKVLKESCKEYIFPDISIPESGKPLHETLDEMAKIMRSENGIGLAANQVGLPYRIFIMQDNKGKIWEFINPRILESEGVVWMNEGCLSAPGVLLQIPRAGQVCVEAQDRNGEIFKVIALDLEAVCVQHEMDHLNGIFFTEKVDRQQRRAAFRKLGIRGI